MLNNTNVAVYAQIGKVTQSKLDIEPDGTSTITDLLIQQIHTVNVSAPEFPAAYSSTKRTLCGQDV